MAAAEATETLQLTTPFHTAGITNRDLARSHYQSGRQIGLYKGPRFDATSTHQRDYTLKPLPERPAAPPAALRAPQPFDASSTYLNDYRRHEVEPREAPKLLSPNVTSKWDPDAVSSYSREFTPKAIAASRELPQSPPARPPIKFDATSSYTSTFVPHAIEPRAPVEPLLATGPHVPFDGTTTSKDAYQAWELEARAAQPPPPLRAAVPFDGRTTSRDAFRGWQLPPSFAPIGLELAGDMMHALVPRGAPLPFTGKHIFSTVHDDQTELCILILSGDSTRASECELLGQFDLSGVPRGAARSPQIENPFLLTLGNSTQVTCHVSADRVLSVVARDLSSSRQYQWLQNGRMLVRTLSPAVREAASPLAAGAEPIAETMFPSAAVAMA